MNVAGKSLQDIYDAGSRRLEELQASQKSALNDTSDGHLDARVKVEPESLKQLEDKTKELEEEIRNYLSRGLERVEKTVNAESQQNERYIGRLVESLVLLSKKFSESIGQLREAAESELNDSCSDSEDIFAAHSRSIKSQLTDEGATSIDSCRTSGSEAQHSLASTVDDSWQSVFEAETDAADGLINEFDEDIEQVESRADGSRIKLQERLNEKLLAIEERSSEATASIRTNVDQLIDQSERHAFAADVRLKEKFSSLLFENSTSFDELASRATSEMVSLHESSMADLSMKSQELSREMDTLAETVTDSAMTKSGALQQNGSEMIASYTNELHERLEANKDFHKDLESEREQLVSEIYEELVDVKAKFEEKLTALAKSTLETMRNICSEAETAIATAQQTCASECKTQATSRQEEIEETTKKFIDKITSTKAAALVAINKAAGATGDDAAEAALSKKSKGSKGDSANGDTASGDITASAETSEPKDPAQLLAELDDGETPHSLRPSETMVGLESRKRKKDRKNSDKRSSGDKK